MSFRKHEKLLEEQKLYVTSTKQDSTFEKGQGTSPL